MIGLYWAWFSPAAKRGRETGDVLPKLTVFVGKDEELVARMFFCRSMEQAVQLVNADIVRDAGGRGEHEQ